MAWDDIGLTKVADLYNHATLNSIKDNMDAIAQPPLAEYIHGLADGDYTTTSLNYMVPIDSTNMKLSVTTTGGTLICLLLIGRGYSTNGALTPAFGISVDDSDNGREGRFGRLISPAVGGSTGANPRGWSFIMPLFNLEAGVYEIEPVYASGPGPSANTLTLEDGEGIYWGIWQI